MWDNKRHSTNGYTPVCKAGKWGAVDEHGNIVIKLEWDFISWVTVRKQAIVALNGKYGVVDINNNLVIPLEWDEIHFLYDHTYGKEYDPYFEIRRFQNPDIEWTSLQPRPCYCGVADNTGTVLIAPEWDVVSHLSKDLLIIWKKIQEKRYYGVIQLGGRLVIPPVYDGILPFRYGHIWVKKGHCWGLLDRQGELVHKLCWTGVKNLHMDYYYKVNRYGGWGVLRHDGAIIVDFQWDNIRCAYGSILQFEGKCGKQWHPILTGKNPFKPLENIAGKRIKR